MICNTILDAIGHTPMIRLNKMTGPEDAEILVKYEGVNIGGSIKTRTAYNMLKSAAKNGKINQNSVIVEPTSGNQGIGIALVGAVMGYKVKIIMPDSVSEERRKLIKNYGAEVVLIHDDGDIGACIEECIQTAKRMAAEDPNVFIPSQFDNPDNPKAHIYYTATEILEKLTARLTAFAAVLARAVQSAV